MKTLFVAKLFALLVVFLGLTYSFVTNGFGVAPWVDWSIWEQSSEAMVLQRIEVDLLGRDASALGLASYGTGETSVFDRLSPEGISSLSSTAPTEFVPYESEIGGQAYFWSFVWRDLGCASISCLHLASSALTAAFVIALFVGLTVIGSIGFGGAWLISIFASPWMTYAARNLFWSPGLYLLPSIAAVGLVIANTRFWRLIAALGVFAAFAIKYVATGYHEFTAFTMLAAAMPIIAIIFESSYSLNKRKQWINCLFILLSSGIAMLFTLVVHAIVMTGSAATGLRQIWVNTILRRTYGDSSDYDPSLSASLDASPIDVIWKYVWSDWSTDVLSFSIDRNGSLFSVGIGRVAFATLIILSIAICLYRLRSRDHLWKRDSALLIIGFAIPVVWFISAKGYSFIHTNLLFFLWYFLFVPSLVYIVVSFSWSKRRVGVRYASLMAGKIDVSSEDKGRPGASTYTAGEASSRGTVRQARREGNNT